MGLIWKRLKRSYALGKLAASSPEDYYEMLEMGIMGVGVSISHRMSIISRKFDNVDGTLHKIKTLAIELQRHKPQDWNLFLDTVLITT